MTDSVWVTTNAVERKNRDCSSHSPQYPKLAMIQAYKMDKVINSWQLKKASYRSKTDEARVSA